MASSTEDIVEALRDSLIENERLRRQNDSLTTSLNEPVAIVGMACRFPGGIRDAAGLWDLVASGTDAISGFPRNRGWEEAGVLDGASYVPAGGFVYDADEFDEGFFGISPREALAMDPQQRLMLEVSWEALEYAGIDAQALRGTKTGVFAGAVYSGYGSDLLGSESAGYVMTGSMTAVISGRVSYALGLEGPAVTVDTACSSSLMALHLACQELRAGECTLALAGGVTVMASPASFTEFARQQGLAADGRCKAFGAGADGIGWGEGAGMLVLERLSDAQRHGRRVLAVIRGSAVNQDGASNGLTAPNGPSQQRLIRAVLATAQLTAADVDAVEAHGTGTVLGDPIEAQALIATYGQGRPDDRPLWLGSVKSNIGHAQAAAGVAGVLKMVLALQHQELPPTLHAEEPSPHIDWSAGKVRLLTRPMPWPSGDERRRRAGISAFGISGTNVHVIVEEAPEPRIMRPSASGAGGSGDGAPGAVLGAAAGPVAWLVSGRSAAALAAQAARLAAWAGGPGGDAAAADVAWSLAVTRSVFEHRAVVVGAGRGELAAGLSAVAAGEPAAGVISGAVRAGGAGKAVFVFPGQGGQWAGMGAELAAVSPVFAARLAECSAALEPYTGWRVEDVLAQTVLSGTGGVPGLDRVDVVQPALWAVMVSLAAVWEAAGVIPDAVAGHSQGEIAAATVAGILSLPDAAKVVALRSKALSALAGRGAMASVAEAAEVVAARLAPWEGRLSVAAVNAPDASVVSGEPGAVAAMVAACEADGVRARVLPVDYASHSPQVEALEAEITAALAGITPGRGRIPMISAMTGQWTAGPQLDARYWYQSLRAPVDFARAVGVLAEDGYRGFVEVSPHPVLTGAVAASLERAGQPPTLIAGTLRRDDGGQGRLLTSLAAAHVAGLAVDWPAVLLPARHVPLPTYAFQRQHYWSKGPVTVSQHAAGGNGGGTGDEARFWAAVDGGDVARLADALGVDGRLPFEEVMPALSAWRRRERERSASASWRYRVTWAPLSTPAPAALRGTWLLVVPADRGDGELAGWCAAALTAGGTRVISVRVDAGTTGRAELTARISQALAGGGPANVPPEQAADAPGGEDATAVAGVLSLLALRREPVPGYPQVAEGLAGTLGLVQGLGDAGIQAPLWVLTRGAVAALPAEAPDPVQAGVWGLGRVVGLEHPDRWGGLIDLPPVAGEPVAGEPVVGGPLLGGPVPDERAAARLRVLLAGCGEDQAAIRPVGILVRRLVRAGLPGGKPGRALSGSVLVTGAGGAIGPDLSGWLAARGVPRLVLTGRRGPGTPGTPSIAAALAGAGTAVAVAACDLTDRAQAAGLVAWARNSGPPLTAVIHAALSVTLQPVDATDLADLQLTMGAKTGGAAVLDELTETAGLEAFVLFSSISATWGVRDHSTYAAANAYLDALAENRRARGLPATSIAWGVWDSGSRFDPSLAALRPQTVDPTRLARQGMRLFEPERALAAFGQVLDGDETALAVVDVDWERFSAVYTAARRWRLLDEIDEARPAAPAGPVTGGELATRLTGLDQAERERAVTGLVCEHAAAVLGHASDADVDPDRAFRDMGFDSLTAVELRDRVVAASGLALPSTVVFDYPSPVTLAREIIARLSGNAEAASQRPPVPVFAAAPGEPVAIVGMGCRFPGGVTSPEELWELLSAGADVIGAFPADRGWDTASLVNPDRDQAGTSYVGRGGFMAGAVEFDAGFFGISPREALAMDPQQRLLLETAWEAVERAGIDPATLRGTATGVFAGASASRYAAGAPGALAGAEGHLITGNATSVISGRVSYVLGLEGPAVTVDTACSSALVAVHLACQALRAGECSAALAGGVMVISDPGEFVGFSRQQALAADGRCKAFSADADGMGLAEGAGMVLLERLSEARRHGHPVLAVITGSAVNQDGASNGLTAPNGPSQQRVIAAALASARLSADQVDAVEAHGTGTTLGDPIEAQALIAAYGQHRERPLWLGSVKSNIGHAQQASGVAGLVKMVLALQHGLLPPTLHAEEPSPHVDWAAGEVRLLTEPVSWSANGTPRRAGVSAFGISGTNAHLILEDPPATCDSTDLGPGAEAGVPAQDRARTLPVLNGGSGTHAWLVSAKTAPGLAAQASRLAEWAVSRPGLDPADVGWSLATTRSLFDHRAVVVGAGTGELSAGLAAIAAGQPSARVVSGTVPPGWPGKVAFVFPGQGGQWAGMGAELAAASPVFAARLAQCSAALAPHTGWRVEEVLAGPAVSETDTMPGLGQVDVVQPVLWAVMVSLAAVWEAAGVVPDAVAGHSQGEIAAAVVAGILTLEDAARVVALRSRALTALAGRGAMMSVAEPADAAARRLTAWEGRLSVAAVNGPDTTVVSGDPDAVAALAAACESDGVRARVLPVDYASHSPQVEALKAEITAALGGIAPSRARVPMVSAMTGELLDGPELDAGYWYASLRAPVEFARSVTVLAADGHQVFIEVSPHPVLTAGITAIADATAGDPAPASASVVTGTLRRDDGGPARLLASLAGVDVAGVPIDWANVLPAAARVELPTYAFQRRRYWPEPVPVAGGAGAGADAANTVAEARFWAALEGGHLQELAAELGVDAHRPFREVLPALASWRRRARAESAAAGWRYQVTWVPVPVPGPATLAGRWLLAVPAGEVAGELATGCAAALAAHGARVITVQAAREGAGGQELAALIREALAVAEPGEAEPAEAIPLDGVAGVVSLLALDETALPGVPGVAAGLAGTAGLVQALSDVGLAAPLWVLTQGGVAAVPGDTVGSAAQGQVWGLGRVAALELPELWGGLVDVPPVLSEQAGRLLCGVLAGCGEDQAAVRPSGVFGRRLVRASAAPAIERWAPSGAVLVMGGTGAIGGHVARWLASRGARRVVLASRSGPAAAGVTALAAELAGAGTAVDITSCDSGSDSDIAGLVARLSAGPPPLTAVFHAAGIGFAGTVLETSPADLAVALAAKAGGAAALDAATAGLDLEAFVLFSSGAAIWGSAVQAGYATANAYLDALAENRHARGLPATSISWGLWGGDGMASGGSGAYLVRLGLREMDPASAMHLLAQVLDSGQRMATVADIDWEQFASVFTLRRPSPLISSLPEVAQALAAAAESGGESGEGELARRLAALPEQERQPMLTSLVQAETAAILGYQSPDEVEADRPFSDLGMDSLTAVELRTRLSAATGLRLPTTMIFDYPTPLVMAAYLLAKTGLQEVTQSQVFDVLDELKAAVSEIASDDADHPAVVARIEAMLRELRDPGKGADDDGADIRAATNDEMFELIEKEFKI